MDGMQRPTLAAEAAGFHRRAYFQPATFDPAERTIELVWTTGADVERRDFWTGERWVERLAVTAEAIDLSRLNAGAPFLNTHAQWDLRDVIGVVERAWVANGEGRALVRFSPRDDVAPILEDVRAGILRNISVGYRVQEWRESAEPGGVKVREAVRWQPAEISLVPVPADPGAQVRAAEPITRGQPAPHNPEVRMDATTPGAQGAPSPVASQPAPATLPDFSAERAAAEQAARAAEIERIRAITAAGQTLGLAERAAELVKDGTALADAQRLLIDAAGAVAAPAGQVQPARVRVLQDEKDTFLGRAADALHARFTRTAPTEGAREFAGMGLHGMLREFAFRSGAANAHRMTPEDLADFAFRSHASADFASVLANSANKSVRDMYGSYPNTWSAWTDEIEVDDFKTITAAFVGPFPELETIPEGGPVTMGSIAEEAETYAVQERGRLIALTRVAIVNDDTRAFERLLRNAAMAGYNTLRRVVFGILTTNAAMADSIALFNASHNNLGSAGNLSASTYAELRALLNKQSSPVRTGSGEAAQPLPPPTQVALLFGPDEEDTALELLGNRIVPTATGAVLPDSYRASTIPIMDPLLDTGNDPYYLVRRDLPGIEIAYLRGRRAPTVTSAEVITHTGMTFRCMFDFGAKAVTWRTMAANLG